MIPQDFLYVINISLHIKPKLPHQENPAACVNGVRAQITFPSCWNGKDLVTGILLKNKIIPLILL
jgi:hypothetical protein